MEIDESIALVLEQPIAHACEDFVQLGWRLNQTAVFGFQACNALCHRAINPPSLV
jgi:hypothetical protein